MNETITTAINAGPIGVAVISIAALISLLGLTVFITKMLENSFTAMNKLANRSTDAEERRATIEQEKLKVEAEHNRTLSLLTDAIGQDTRISQAVVETLNSLQANLSKQLDNQPALLSHELTPVFDDIATNFSTGLDSLTRTATALNKNTGNKLDDLAGRIDALPKLDSISEALRREIAPMLTRLDDMSNAVADAKRSLTDMLDRFAPKPDVLAAAMIVRETPEQVY